MKYKTGTHYKLGTRIGNFKAIDVFATHWHDECNDGPTCMLEIVTGACSVSVWPTSDELRTLATMLIKQADALDQHIAQVQSEKASTQEAA